MAAPPRFRSATATAMRSTPPTRTGSNSTACASLGYRPTGVVLPEIVEYEDHPWFIGVQFHPELKVAAVRAAPAVCVVQSGRDGAEPAGCSFSVGWAKRSVPTISPHVSQEWWARRFAPLPTLRLLGRYAL